MDPDYDDFAIIPVSVRPKSIYGLRTDVIGNIQYNLNQEVIYPVEGVIAFHDYVSNKQRFLRLPEGITPKIIAINTNRKFLAVLEQGSAREKWISVYELATLKKRRTLELPPNAKTNQIAQIDFTYDSKAIVVMTNAPEDWLFLLIMDMNGTVYEGRPTLNLPHTTLDYVACSPFDTTCVAVCGKNLITLLNKSDKGFASNVVVKSEFHARSLIFLLSDTLLVGTAQNQLVLIENGEVKHYQTANGADSVQMMYDQDQVDKEWATRVSNEDKLLSRKVVCMTAFPRGFVFAIFNQVFVFEKVSKFKYERKTVITVPVTLYPEHTYQIQNISIDQRQETVIVTTQHAQIYVAILIVPESLKTNFLKFEPLGPMLHIDNIVDISVCSWKPIVLTASRDQTIRIWNYETEKVELVRKFQVDINIVELSATGLMAAIGFADQLRITQIFMDELNIVKTYNFPRCRDVKYSNYGHLMAAAYDTTIAITSVYSLEMVTALKGHSGTVLTVAWSKTDKYLISGGAEGAIYQWDIETGARVQEIVNKGTEYRSVCVTQSDPMIIYAITSAGMIREFQKNRIIREMVPSSAKTPLTDICLSRSDLIMYVANETGEMFNVQMPFLDAGGGTCTVFRFFVSRVNKMRFTYDGTLLIAISERGTLAIWTLDHIEGRVAPMDSDLLKSQEVLISRNILKEKNDQISTLELRLKQQAEEFQYQLSQNEIFDGQQLAEVHRSYCTALEELKRKNSEIEEEHAQEMNQITFQINDLKDDHRKEMQNLANQYSERMLIEYQKFSNLRDSMLKLREDYEGKLKNSAGTLQDTVEGLESDYKRQLDERKELIRELMSEMTSKKTEFIEYCRQVEVENDRNMVETQLKYENKLTAERGETLTWRGKAAVLEKKYESVSKEIEVLIDEVETLKEEHEMSQNTIVILNRSIEDLQKEIADRDYAINAKEVRIQDLMQKNQELEKYKLVLSHKIAELNAQIEPREFQINDKRKHIIEMEHELAGLSQNNTTLELQLKEMKDKYISSVTELKVERHRSRAAREGIHNMCSDIYHLSGKISSVEDLRANVKELFQKYSTDAELKRMISLDANVRDEFQRQRAQVERVLKIYKSKVDDKSEKQKYDKLFKENVVLLEEIDQLKAVNDQLRLRVKKTAVQPIRRRVQPQPRKSVDSSSKSFMK